MIGMERTIIYLYRQVANSAIVVVAFYYKDKILVGKFSYRTSPTLNIVKYR